MEKIGFIGSGKMARALAAAILKSGLTNPENTICSDISAPQLENLAKELGVRTTPDNAEIVKNSDIIFLAVKPQTFTTAVADLAPLVTPDQIIISIMAGVKIGRIAKILPGKVVRVMPNVACLAGQMAAGFAAAPNVTPDELARVREILNAAGTALQVTEPQLDAVTGLSGSGPAFIAYIIDQFINAGTEAGLDQSTARELALQTAAGTIELLRQWDMPPAELIEMVSSPNGTTVAGREILENSEIANIINKTVLRAAQRSRELGNN